MALTLQQIAELQQLFQDPKFSKLDLTNFVALAQEIFNDEDELDFAHLKENLQNILQNPNPIANLETFLRNAFKTIDEIRKKEAEAFLKSLPFLRAFKDEDLTTKTVEFFYQCRVGIINQILDYCTSPTRASLLQEELGKLPEKNALLRKYTYKAWYSSEYNITYDTELSIYDDAIISKHDLKELQKNGAVNLFTAMDRLGSRKAEAVMVKNIAEEKRTKQEQKKSEPPVAAPSNPTTETSASTTTLESKTTPATTIAGSQLPPHMPLTLPQIADLQQLFKARFNNLDYENFGTLAQEIFKEEDEFDFPDLQQHIQAILLNCNSIDNLDTFLRSLPAQIEQRRRDEARQYLKITIYTKLIDDEITTDPLYCSLVQKNTFSKMLQYCTSNTRARILQEELTQLFKANSIHPLLRNYKADKAISYETEPYFKDPLHIKQLGLDPTESKEQKPIKLFEAMKIVAARKQKTQALLRAQLQSVQSKLSELERFQTAHTSLQTAIAEYQTYQSANIPYFDLTVDPQIQEDLNLDLDDAETWPAQDFASFYRKLVDLRGDINVLLAEVHTSPESTATFAARVQTQLESAARIVVPDFFATTLSTKERLLQNVKEANARLKSTLPALLIAGAKVRLQELLSKIGNQLTTIHQDQSIYSDLQKALAEYKKHDHPLLKTKVESYKDGISPEEYTKITTALNLAEQKEDMSWPAQEFTDFQTRLERIAAEVTKEIAVLDHLTSQNTISLEEAQACVTRAETIQENIDLSVPETIPTMASAKTERLHLVQQANATLIEASSWFASLETLIATKFGTNISMNSLAAETKEHPITVSTPTAELVEEYSYADIILALQKTERDIQEHLSQLEQRKALYETKYALVAKLQEEQLVYRALRLFITPELLGERYREIDAAFASNSPRTLCHSYQEHLSKLKNILNHVQFAIKSHADVWHDPREFMEFTDSLISTYSRENAQLQSAQQQLIDENARYQQYLPRLVTAIKESLKNYSAKIEGQLVSLQQQQQIYAKQETTALEAALTEYYSYNIIEPYVERFKEKLGQQYSAIMADLNLDNTITLPTENYDKLCTQLTNLSKEIATLTTDEDKITTPAAVQVFIHRAKTQIAAATNLTRDGAFPTAASVLQAHITATKEVQAVTARLHETTRLLLDLAKNDLHASLGAKKTALVNQLADYFKTKSALTAAVAEHKEYQQIIPYVSNSPQNQQILADLGLTIEQKDNTPEITAEYARCEAELANLDAEVNALTSEEQKDITPEQAHDFLARVNAKKQTIVKVTAPTLTTTAVVNQQNFRQVEDANVRLKKATTALIDTANRQLTAISEAATNKLSQLDRRLAEHANIKARYQAQEQVCSSLKSFFSHDVCRSSELYISLNEQVHTVPEYTWPDSSSYKARLNNSVTSISTLKETVPENNAPISAKASFLRTATRIQQNVTTNQQNNALFEAQMSQAMTDRANHNAALDQIPSLAQLQKQIAQESKKTEGYTTWLGTCDEQIAQHTESFSKKTWIIADSDRDTITAAAPTIKDQIKKDPTNLATIQAVAETAVAKHWYETWKAVFTIGIAYLVWGNHPKRVEAAVAHAATEALTETKDHEKTIVQCERYRALLTRQTTVTTTRPKLLADQPTIQVIKAGFLERFANAAKEWLSLSSVQSPTTTVRKLSNGKTPTAEPVLPTVTDPPVSQPEVKEGSQLPKPRPLKLTDDWMSHSRSLTHR